MRNVSRTTRRDSRYCARRRRRRIQRRQLRPAAWRSRRRRDTIVSRLEKLHRGNNRYDSCRELHLARSPTPSSPGRPPPPSSRGRPPFSSLFLPLSFSRLSLSLLRSFLAFSIRPARGARRCRDWNTYARKSGEEL